MTRRFAVRLDQGLDTWLRAEVRLRHTTLSALVRAALQQFLGESSVTGAAGAPQRPSASLDAPASSRVSGERTGTEDSV
jgi:hypothetical protein